MFTFFTILSSGTSMGSMLPASTDITYISINIQASIQMSFCPCISLSLYIHILHQKAALESISAS